MTIVPPPPRVTDLLRLTLSLPSPPHALQFAGLFVEKLLAARERRLMEKPITTDEYEFAQQLFDSDGKIDLSEYMALELLRLGKVPPHRLGVVADW